MSRDTSMAEGNTADEQVDEALGGDPVTDITEPLDVEDFDFNEFVEGVRPGRRAVKITMRPDLVAERDKLVESFDEARGKKDTDYAEQVLGEVRALHDRIFASQRIFVIEARSESRREAIREVMAKQGRPEPNKKATRAMRNEWTEEYVLRQLADAIITPSNVTYEGLAKLREVGEPQINILMGAFNDVNTDPLRNVRGLTPDFSRGL